MSVLHYREQINPCPEYQRYAVWSRPQQQLLMDSVYRGLDIPKLYLRQVKAGQYEYEAIDGQQRLRAVWEFFADTFPLNERFTPELGPVRYSELGLEVRKRFDHYQFNVVIIKEGSDREIREMFCRLQNGKPLNSAERRNAMVSGMRDFCANLASHPFFQSARFTNSRMQHQQVAAQAVLLELSGARPANCRDKNLHKLYEDNASFDETRKEAKKARRVFSFLQECFPERTPELKRGYVVSLYLLVSQLMEKYSLSGRHKEIRDFLIDFDHRRRTLVDDIEMVKFTERMSHASDSEDAIDFRHQLLLHEFHRFCPNLVPLDSKRGFDDHQRTAIYRRDGGRCRYCGDEVPYSGFHADHVVPHVKGGPTTVDNGWLSCKRCNQIKGSKTVGRS